MNANRVSRSFWTALDLRTMLLRPPYLVLPSLYALRVSKCTRDRYFADPLYLWYIFLGSAGLCSWVLFRSRIGYGSLRARPSVKSPLSQIRLAEKSVCQLHACFPSSLVYQG